MPLRARLLIVVLGCYLAPSSSAQGAGPVPIQELPVNLQQAVTAGKTAVGTKVQAKLMMATLVNGTVVPRNAVLSGEVLESTAKTGNEPSKIGIRMDSVTWKNGSASASASIRVYLTGWFFPTVAQPGQNLQYGPPPDASRTWNGAGAYPDPNSPAYKPFPGSDSEKEQAAPDTPNSITAKQRVRMKGVDVEHGSDDELFLISKHSNIKLDRFTTYVLASGDLQK
jgi:hypothetical protein